MNDYYDFEMLKKECKKISEEYEKLLKLRFGYQYSYTNCYDTFFGIDGDIKICVKNEYTFLERIFSNYGIKFGLWYNHVGNFVKYVYKVFENNGKFYLNNDLDSFLLGFIVANGFKLFFNFVSINDNNNLVNYNYSKQYLNDFLSCVREFLPFLKIQLAIVGGD